MGLRQKQAEVNTFCGDCHHHYYILCVQFYKNFVVSRSALTECNVLSDVLHMAKEKHYMTLHPVPAKQQEEKYPSVQMFTKKKVCSPHHLLGYCFDLSRK